MTCCVDYDRTGYRDFWFIWKETKITGKYIYQLVICVATEVFVKKCELERGRSLAAIPERNFTEVLSRLRAQNRTICNSSLFGFKGEVSKEMQQSSRFCLTEAKIACK